MSIGKPSIATYKALLEHYKVLGTKYPLIVMALEELIEFRENEESRKERIDRIINYLNRSRGYQSISVAVLEEIK